MSVNGVTWEAIRPRFERVVFRMGYHEFAEETMLSVATVYALANGVQVPQRRTVRDVARVVEAWETENDSPPILKPNGSASGA